MTRTNGQVFDGVRAILCDTLDCPGPRREIAAYVYTCRACGGTTLIVPADRELHGSG